MVNEDAALLNRRVTHMTPAALFNRRLQGVAGGVFASNHGGARIYLWLGVLARSAV
jgi:hypothetical protein